MYIYFSNSKCIYYFCFFVCACKEENAQFLFPSISYSQIIQRKLNLFFHHQFILLSDGQPPLMLI